jgi:hypothetical protein
MNHHGLPVASNFDGFVQTCRRCRGTGLIPRSWILQYIWFRVRGVAECPHCHGMGFLAASDGFYHGETPTQEFDLVR